MLKNLHLQSIYVTEKNHATMLEYPLEHFTKYLNLLITLFRVNKHHLEKS